MSQPTHLDILKRIWAAEPALRENLLLAAEVADLHAQLLTHLDQVLTGTSLPALRYRKLRSKPTIWIDAKGYPKDRPWALFEPYLELFAQAEAGKTIKHRLKTEGLFVEARSQGEDLHLLVGERDGSGAKAHMILDGKTGEIRVEDNRTEPTTIVAKIESIITLPDGRRIRTTRQAIEFLEADAIDGGDF